MDSKPSFIIIGAAGFIGSSMSARLKNNGYEVFEILRGQISGIDTNFNYLSDLLKTERKQVVIDFSYTSVPNSSFENPVKDYSENLYNVIRHLEFVKQLPNATYVYISSGGTVYGNASEVSPIDENHPNTPISPYGITKLSCEKYVLMYKEVYGLDIKILRPSNIYGPGQKPFRGQGIVATAIAKMLKGESLQVFGDGKQVRDYLYIDDFCNALYDVIFHGDTDLYNVGSGIGCSINDILNKVAQLTGVSLTIDHLPYRPFDVHYNVLNFNKIKLLNNWSPRVSIDDGLKESVAWIKSQNF